MEILIKIVFFVLGFAIGDLVRLKKPAVGVIHIDTSIPDEPPYLFLELKNCNVQDLEKKGHVIFTVDHTNFVPRK